MQISINLLLLNNEIKKVLIIIIAGFVRTRKMHISLVISTHYD